jgi:NitT/TauT family transport system permease protein
MPEVMRTGVHLRAFDTVVRPVFSRLARGHHQPPLGQRGRARRLGVYRALSLLVLLATWEIAASLANSNLFPTVSQVSGAFLDILSGGILLEAFSLSIQAYVVGALAALVLGIVCGLLLGYFRELDHLFEPFINAGLVLPSVAYIPILMALLGVGFATRAVVVFEYAFLVIVVNTLTGVKTVDRSLVDMGRSFGLSRLLAFRAIIAPAAMPGILAGLRLGLGRSVKGMVNAEVLIAIVGLGGLLKHYGGRFDMDYLVAVIAFVVGFGILLTFGLDKFDRRVNRWNASANY